MSSSTGVFINPPPFGTVGDYSNLPTYDIGDRVHVNWTSSPSDSVLWLIQDGEGLLCEELNLAKTSCEVLLCKSNQIRLIHKSNGTDQQPGIVAHHGTGTS